MKRLKRALLKWLINGNQDFLIRELSVRESFLRAIEYTDMSVNDVFVELEKRNGDD